VVKSWKQRTTKIPLPDPKDPRLGELPFSEQTPAVDAVSVQQKSVRRDNQLKRLDTLLLRMDEFEASKKHVPYVERKREVLAIIKEIGQLQPLNVEPLYKEAKPFQTLQVIVDNLCDGQETLREKKKERATDREIKTLEEANERQIYAITNGLHARRIAILPPVQGYDPYKPEKLLEMSHEPHFKHVYQFSKAVEEDQREGRNQKRLPHLTALAVTARHMISMYQLTVEIKKIQKEYGRTPALWQANLGTIEQQLELAKKAYLEVVPPLSQMNDGIKQALEGLDHPTSVRDLDAPLLSLTTKSATFARHFPSSLQRAYAEDMKLAAKNEVAAQDAFHPLLDSPRLANIVYRARWAMSAKRGYDLADRYFRTLLDPAIAVLATDLPQSNFADSVVNGKQKAGLQPG